MAKEFVSGFAAKLNAMLDFREARGFKRTSYLPSLLKFDRFCAERYPGESQLRSAIVLEWIDGETVAEHSLVGPVGAIRQFGKYLNAVDEEAYILPDKYTPKHPAFTPYIFTDTELSMLFRAIDTMIPNESEPYLHEIAPVLFRLTYTCGLRPNEGRDLLAENVNLDNGVVLITRTKMNKERYVVMSDDMLALTRKYDVRRKIFGGGNAYFFPSNSGGALSKNKVPAAFTLAWTTAMSTQENPVPPRIRVYDLRHRFASACLNRWLDEGFDVMAKLPYLSTYMGHSSYDETIHYVHMLPENLIKSPGVDWSAFDGMFPDIDGAEGIDE